MWQPSARIKHQLPDPGWPTADAAVKAKLFSPVNIGKRQALQRTWVPAMVPWRATDDGFVTDAVIDWYRRFAEGRPGVIVVEATGIRDIPSGPLLRIGHDRFLPGLERLTKAVKEASGGETLLFIQIIDFLTVRRRPPADKYFSRFLQITTEHIAKLKETCDITATAPDDVRGVLPTLSRENLENILTQRELEDLDFGYRERVSDTHLPHIRDLPETLPPLFASAAHRAYRAGFDGVELHYAHAYTVASFLSARNNRMDGFGGSRENRVRLPLNIISGVRDSVGSSAVLGCRFLGDEVIDHGSHLEDAIYYAKEFAGAGLDFLSVSKGGKFDDAKPPKVGWAVYPYTGPSGYECMPTIYSDEKGPFSRNVPLAAQIRSAVRGAGYDLPVVTAGGIAGFNQAEEILRDGHADIVGAARQTLADPDWFLKMKLGRGNEVRRCKFTNYCEALDQKHKTVTCQTWDRLDLDSPEVVRDSSGKRRLTAPPWKREPKAT